MWLADWLLCVPGSEDAVDGAGGLLAERTTTETKDNGEVEGGRCRHAGRKD